jgi:tRNA threonylcarbamoyladenosine biosynthesis protein TsaB
MLCLRHLLTLHPTVLLLDAASARVQLGLWHARRVDWAMSETEAGIGVFTCAESLLARAGLTLASVDAFLFCEGPGSVLGIRTAAVALRTWTALQARPIYAYQSLPLVARALAATQPDVHVIADARRDSWHVARADLATPIKRVPTAELAGTYVMPEGFRHWSPLPASLGTTSYDLAQLLPATTDIALFQLTAAPDTFMHDEPTYATWNAQVHQAPAAVSNAP